MDSDNMDDGDETVPSAHSPGSLSRGTVVDGRFRIEGLTGRGGMGSVYRARDLHSGQPVALKLLHAATSPDVVYRFNREAYLLSELRHPAIVSYVHHGHTAEGQPFLVMEWLEGEDLAHRLAREPLTLPDTLSLLRRAAEGLASAHQQGIVHRDLKPSNLFLRGGRPEDVVLLDFGLARHATRSLVMVTGTGMVLGTPGYMAPEQASSQPEIPPAADIFSLGCVLYECLTGRPPFEAPHFAAALAKILYAEPAPLHTHHPGLPPGLQVLVDCMLMKDPRRRLSDAASLLGSLSALESVHELLLPHVKADARPASLDGTEQQLASVLLVSLPALASGEREEDAARRLALRDMLRTVFTPHGARVELLADGSLVATLMPERGTATDQAALAARCALTLKERCPEASVVLVTGLGVFRERFPVGKVMDAAGRLLRQLEHAPASFVMMDEVTAGLLGPGFQLARFDSGTFALHGEQLGTDTSRPLQGKPTSCVGREQELALLDFTFTSCVEEPAARVVLVTAPAGVGKSRLRHEFLRRAERREQRPLVLLGRGDPMGAGASYGLLGQALRQLCGLAEGKNLEERRARLYQRVGMYLSEAEARETAEFLGELCTIPFPDEDSPRLRAARGDPRLMSAQVSRALVGFLRAECAHQPVLLVLEDLHWSDALTVKLVDEVLRELAEQPLMVLALARPEVKELFPGLWSRRMQELPLKGLSRKAGTQLVREVLGPDIPEALVHRAVEQSDGNALFLEELIRMVAEGRGDAVPETVLAVLQSRLMRMEPGARQVLLAASLFGHTFWSGGVRELLGWQGEPGTLEKHLGQLVEQEVIGQQPSSHFPAVDEYRFRHALVREAAYGLVPESQRSTGHRLAGTWLEQMGEPEMLVLARHYQLGHQPERAMRCYTRAAEQLFKQHDFQGTTRCVEGALACGVSGGELARLRALQAVVAFWMEDVPTCLSLGGPALAGLKAGGLLWCRLMGYLILANAHEGHPEEVARLSELLVRTSPEPEATAGYIEAVAMLQATVNWSGDRQMMEGLLARILEVGAAAMPHETLTLGWMRNAEAFFHYHCEARPWRAFQLADLAMRDFDASGATLNMNVLRALSGGALAALGDVSGALARLREAWVSARRAEQHLVVFYAEQYLLQTLTDSGQPEHLREARGLAFEWLKSAGHNSYKGGLAHVMLARVLVASEEPREAEAYARKACELLAPFRPDLSRAHAVLSTVLLAGGNAAEARQVAELGVEQLERMRRAGVHAVPTYLALVEACFALGDDAAAEAVLRKASECVLARARDIPELAARERFLCQVPENARTLELARRRWGEAAA